jgi:predicted O-linked N-acetylglucosamine transferase (SPINDLY family)
MERPLATDDATAALEQARGHFQAGRWQKAEELCQQLLQSNSNQVHVLHMLGVIAGQSGRYQLAADYLLKTVRLQPDFAAAHNDLGNALVLQGRRAEAIESFREAVRCKPDFPSAHSNLGNALREEGRFDQAVASLREAVRLAPDFIEARFNLAVALQAQSELDQAVATYRQVLCYKPSHVDAFCNLGMVLWRQGKFDEAFAQYQHALRLDPEHALTHNNLGAALQEQGRLSEAEASLRLALRAKPDYADASCNLGIVLWKQGNMDESVAHYQKALRIQPDHAEAHVNLGNVYKDEARLDEALESYRAALHIRPDAADIRSNLLLALNYHPDYDARAILEECARWNRTHAEPLKKLIQPHSNLPDPQRRLRIGYVSPDLREHVDSFFLIPLLSNHDHKQYEIACYANVPRPDAMTQRLQGYADIWRSTVGLSDQQVAELVRGDQIDILVDLELHAAKNRLLMFARKPAPVQVAWLGYPGTTGLSTMDYRLTDPYLDPPGLFDVFYSEESIRLPDTFWCYDPLNNEPPVNSLPALTTGTITFGCLNNFCKVNKGCLRLWAEVLRKVPQSRLLLRAPLGQARDWVKAALQKEGIAEKRIELVESVPRPKYLETYQRIDLGLDPVPCSGHTTSLDAFWMGVPTVTLLGKTAMGRAGFSQLCNLGLSELAAQTPEEYVELAARLARDPGRLQELRGSLRERMKQSPLMDGKRFAQHMEKAYRQMWHRWCADQGPGALDPISATDGSPQPQGSNPDVEAYFQRGIALAQRGRYEEAARSFQEGLRLKPDSAGAHNDLGMILILQGRLPEAVKSFREAVRLKPDFHSAYSNLGNALRELGDLDNAVASLRKAVLLRPDFVEAHLNLGIALEAQGKLDEATASYRQAVHYRPNYADAHFSLGNALIRLGKPDEAAAHLQETLRFKGNDAAAHHSLAIAFKALGKKDQAIDHYQQALRLKPDADVHILLGNAFQEGGDLSQALTNYRQAALLQPDNSVAHSNLGNALREMGQLEEAEASLQRALALKPDFVAATFNLGIVLWKQGRLEEAAARYQQTLRLQPDHLDAHLNLAWTLKQQGRLHDAEASLAEALRLKPDWADAHFNRALLWLIQGDWVRGLPEYEFRAQGPKSGNARLKERFWDGSPLNGRTILLYAEQGLGDTLQFVRYVPLVQERGGKVVLVCQQALYRLLESASEVDHLVKDGDPLRAFDFQAPLMSLAHLMGTTPETVPANVPYLTASNELIEKWRPILGEVPGFKVGIFWQGNRQYPADRDRSIPLSHFRALANLPGVKLVSLQKGPGRDQLAACPFPVLDFTEQMDKEPVGPFMDTAAVLRLLDLVISCDSAVLHLAGALGVPVWALLPFMPDWRWLLDQDHTPWYPSMRLFRQRTRGDWNEVFERIAASLKVHLIEKAT